MKEKDKAKLVMATLRNFCKQFGEDEHAHHMVEVLFKGLLEDEAVFIFGKQEQEGDQVSDDPQIGEGNERTPGEPEGSLPPDSLGEGNREDDLRQSDAL